MDKRRKRGRPSLAAPANNPAPTALTTGKRASTIVTRSSPSRLASPSRTRTSPVRKPSPPIRRSSRPRSTVFGSSAVTSTVTVSPTTEEEETETVTKLRTKTYAQSRGTDATDVPTSKKSVVSTSSVHSSTSQDTVEISPSNTPSESEIAMVTNYIRRSVSKTITSVINNPSREGTHTPTFTNTNTEGGSRYSRSISRSVYEDDDSKAEFSDNAEEDEEEEVAEPFRSFPRTMTPSYCRSLNTPKEYGNRLGVLILMLVMPCLVHYLQWTCSRTCNFQNINFDYLKDFNYVLKDFFAWTSVYAYLLYFFTIFILSGLLYGKKVRLPTERGSTIYHFNLLTTSIVINIICGALEYKKYAIVDFILNHYLEFLVYGFIHAFVTSFWSYLSAGKGVDLTSQNNVYGRSGYFLIDYGQGRLLNPKCFGIIDFKQVHYRMSIITALLYIECFLYKTITIPAFPENINNWWKIIDFYLTNLSVDPAAFLASALVFLYLLDTIVFEHHLASSFELQGEGFGSLLLLRYAATPYLLTSVAKYFFQRRVTIVCMWAPYVALIVLTSGLIIKRLSNAYKYKYRVDPTNKIFLGVDTIHTFQGRRLLLGNLWGCLRQPNYMGDIIALIGLGLPIFIKFAWPPLLSVLIIIVILVHRSKRVHMRNAARYHSSWVRYCSIVRNVLLPKIY